MITVHELAEIVSRSSKGTVLRQISRQPGKERYRGNCPWHSDKTPSFDVFVGRDGNAHYYCHSCQRNGSAEWWIRNIEGKSYREARQVRPDPSVAEERKERERRLQMLHTFRDRNPDCCVPDDFLLAHPEWLTT